MLGVNISEMDKNVHEGPLGGKQYKLYHLMFLHLCSPSANNDSPLDNIFNVNSDEILGIIIYKNLAWKSQMDKTAKISRQSIALLRRMRRYLPQST